MKQAPPTTSAATTLQRQEIESQHRQAEGDAGDAEPGQHHADEVEALVMLGAHVLDDSAWRARCR